MVKLEGLSQHFALRPISSEQDLKSYKRFAVEDHIPAAREEFRLSDGVWFNNHANVLDKAKRSGSDTWLSRPDQFCIYRVDGQINTLLTTVEYKPPHKLLVQTIREGFRPMEFWQEIVKPDTILADGPERQRYNAVRLAGSMAVQQFHGMIEYGVGCSFIINGLMDVQLWVPNDDLTTLYYNIGEEPWTRAWRNAAQSKLPKWHLVLDSDRSQLLVESSLDSEADPTASAGRKRGGQSHSHDAPYCTQKCLLRLQQGGVLDPECPNTKLHMLSRRADHHPISATNLVKMLKLQLDWDLDHNCTPIGPCGSSGAPFKITAINLALTYFLYGAGRIRHMLLIGWGGETVGDPPLDKIIQHAISRSVKEIRRFRVVHQDLRPDNILWNAELGRLCTLDRQLLHKHPGALKRLQCGPEERHSKRVRVV
ncbi:hypothetical protein ASPZODRAFT_155549 [Penicilliopsis zonata CBS 506.65]|uniref:Protein kinase domain-containing protein n=1 Tax=Penicilliopsis zonata CBS 506.65 TaxID=1073090 RepID=A0A1L9S4H7_9EURO|nr:hypothetical protein ASPZODRAFT_155549 [Penicilliopsis zonata CBS 506.65]OJJ42069.1 hypothetical protein ASPZODRAFT_155549 [Penicilliopsis zonata CBS 506.65]